MHSEVPVPESRPGYLYGVQVTSISASIAIKVGALTRAAKFSVCSPPVGASFTPVPAHQLPMSLWHISTQPNAERAMDILHPGGKMPLAAACTLGAASGIFTLIKVSLLDTCQRPVTDWPLMVRVMV